MARLLDQPPKIKMKNIVKIALVSSFVVVFACVVSAMPITGGIGFSGTAVLDTSDPNTASKVVSWGTNSVGSVSGTFASYGGGIPLGTMVAMGGPWNFHSTFVNNFWQVDGFTYNVWSTSIFAQGYGLTKIFLQGNVSGNGFSSTPFTCWFQFSNPTSSGVYNFSESLSFSQSTPDGGTTVLLLGAALSGLAVIRRRLVA